MNNKIKKYRKNTGFTQVEIARKVNVSTLAYQRYESGERVPNARTAIRIAQVLGTTVEKLWDGNPIEK